LRPTVNKDINYPIEPGNFPVFTKVIKEWIAGMSTDPVARVPTLFEKFPMVIHHGINVAHTGHYNLISPTETTECVEEKRSDTNPHITRQIFFIDNDGCAEFCPPNMFAILIRVVIIDGKSFQHLFPELLSENPVVEGAMGTKGTEESHLLIPDTASIKKLQQEGDNLICPCWPGNIIKKDANFSFIFEKGYQGQKGLSVCACTEDPLTVTLHAEDFNVPCVRQVKKEVVMVSFP
jgi:hypothetical protein